MRKTTTKIKVFCILFHYFVISNVAMATSKEQTNVSLENLRFDPFLSNSILLDDENDPDINFF